MAMVKSEVKSEPVPSPMVSDGEAVVCSDFVRC